MSFLKRAALVAAIAGLCACEGSDSAGAAETASRNDSGDGGLSGIYANDTLQYEFTAERVYITAPLVGTTATVYEIDGKRVLVGMLGQQQVLTILQDGSLQGPMDMVLKKQHMTLETGDADANATRDASSPAGVVEAYTSAIAALDLATAMSYVSGGDEMLRQSPDRLAAAKADLEREFAAMGGITSTQVIEEEIFEDGATVKLETRFGNGESNQETMYLRKENGRWLLDI